MESDEGDLKLKFLLSGSFSALPDSYIKLRSYLTVHASNIADSYRLRLPKALNNRTTSCPHCHYPWNYSTNSFKLIPTSKREFKDFKKKKKKEIADVQNKEGDINLRNKLVVKCSICTKKTPFSLIKYLNYADKAQPTPEVKTKKKKKKKDKTCGLIIPNEITNGNETSVLNNNNSAKSKKKKKKNRNLENSAQNQTPALSKPNMQTNAQIKNQSNKKLTSMKKKEALEMNKKIVLNPFATQLHGKFQKDLKKKVHNFKQALQEEKSRAKKSLKDFLTLV